jgi:hypothetical protein
MDLMCWLVMGREPPLQRVSHRWTVTHIFRMNYVQTFGTTCTFVNWQTLRNPSTLMLLSGLVRWQTPTNRVFSPESKAKTITQRDVQEPGNMVQFKCWEQQQCIEKLGGGGNKRKIKLWNSCYSFKWEFWVPFAQCFFGTPSIKQEDLISFSLVLCGNET